jgi:hypothetical protein
MKPLPIMYRFGLAVSAVLLLAACNTEEPTPTPEPTAVADTVEATDEPGPSAEPTDEPTATPVPPTNTPEPTATTEPTATPEPEPDYEVNFETADCEFAEPGGRDVECGYLTVPENREDVANGRTVRLHVAIFASDSESPAPDPIIYLEGGPGGDALETIPLVFEMRFAPFLANHTFIMFDSVAPATLNPRWPAPK